MKKQKHRLPVKIISFTIAALLLLIILSLLAWQALTSLDYFRIKDIVIVNGRESSGLLYLKGRNIWKLDLKKESQSLSLLYPSYKKVNLVRVLPNKIFVIFQKRIPVALVRLSRYFYVDTEQVLFDVSTQETGMDFTVITGLNAKLLAPNSGKRYNVEELNLALRIIKEFQNIRPLSALKIRRVNVENAASAAFFLSDTLEVKIGYEDIGGRLNILSTVVLQSGKDVVNIKYIDLRFKEPVVKLYNAK